jgi:chromosome segregation ATPase
VAVGALGYWRGWFSVNKEGDRGVQVDKEKFKKDKAAFSKTVGDKAKAMKEKLAKLWKHSEGLTGDDKAKAEKELGELKTKHDRLEKQIKELDDSGEDKFEDVKKDLSKNLEEVEKKIEELTKKLQKATDK